MFSCVEIMDMVSELKRERGEDREGLMQCAGIEVYKYNSGRSP